MFSSSLPCNSKHRLPSRFGAFLALATLFAAIQPKFAIGGLALTDRKDAGAIVPGQLDGLDDGGSGAHSGLNPDILGVLRPKSQRLLGFGATADESTFLMAANYLPPSPNRKTKASLAVPVISSGTQVNAQVGVQFSYQITASNNPTGFSAAGMPPSISFNPQTGLISGIPEAAGSWPIQLSASNASGVGSTTLQLMIQSEPASSSSSLTPSGPIAINGQDGTVISGLRITSTSGNCVSVSNSTNITIKNSEIGPCGGNGISIRGSKSINVYDSYIHPEITSTTPTGCCDSHDGIVANSSSGITVQGNVIAFGETNIEVTNVNTINVVGNFLLNPVNSDPSQSANGQSRGQHFQAWTGNQNVLVHNNYLLSSLDTDRFRYAENQEDAINFGQTESFVVSDNYIRGGHSRSGCGLITDQAANNGQFLNNTLVDTGQCGIGIASGISQVVDGNRVLNRTPVSGGGNVAFYVWRQYSGDCGPVTFSNNVGTEIQSGGSPNSYWDGGGCSSVTLSNNTWGLSAVTALEPIDTTHPPPAIPPQPFACAVESPFTTQTSWTACTQSAQ